MKGTKLIIGLYLFILLVTIWFEIFYKPNSTKREDQITTDYYNPSRAFFDTALFYANGINVPQSLSKEKEYLLKAAEHNYGPAELALGEFLLFGYEGNIDSIGAIYWFERASKHNVLEASFALGCIYSSNRNGKIHNDSLGLYWFQKAANYGHPIAQYQIGLYHKYGHLLPQNQNLYVLWIKKSAYNGYAMAQYELGNCYKHGICVKRDLFQAFDWFMLSSQQGYSQAHAQVIILTQTCEEKTKETAVLSFPTNNRKVKTDADKMYCHGFDLLFGITGPQDQQAAIPYLIAATIRGSKNAKILLSYCFATAFGVILNKEAALHLYVGKGEIRYDDPSGSTLIEFNIKEDGSFEKTLNFTPEKHKFTR